MRLDIFNITQPTVVPLASDSYNCMRNMLEFIDDAIQRLRRNLGHVVDSEVTVLIPAICRPHMQEYFAKAYNIRMGQTKAFTHDGVVCYFMSPDAKVHVYYNNLLLIAEQERGKYYFSLSIC